MKYIDSIKAIAPHYDVFFIDIWGVIHDGKALYPGVREAFLWLKEQGKTIILLSNAPRRAEFAKINLDRFGIDSSLYDHIVTSGEVAYHHFKSLNHNVLSQLGISYYLLSPMKDLSLLDGITHYHQAKSIQQADFLIALGYTQDNLDEAEFDEILQQAAHANKKMVCVNPDYIVVQQDGSEFPCAGILAKHYEGMGGEVYYFGKPHAEVYEYALTIAAVEKSNIAAIGDSFHTDISGAASFGIDVYLVAHGIHKRDFADALHDPHHLLDCVKRYCLKETFPLPTGVLTGIGLL